MNCEGSEFVHTAGATPQPVTDAEKWILTRFDALLQTVDEQFSAYRFDLAAQSMYEFVWNHYCDWFLELAKPALSGGDASAAASTRHTLLWVLERTLRVLHPIIPFVTEEIWQHVSPQLGTHAASISQQAYPIRDAALVFPEHAASVEWLQGVIAQLRRLRSELNVAPSKTISLLLSGGNAKDRERCARFAEAIAFLARIDRQEWLVAGADAPAAAAAVSGELTLLVPLAGLVDLDAERARLEREIKRIGGEIGKCEGKLASATFVANAPPAVVAQERQRLADWSSQREALAEQLHRLAAG
jgi:valyl-tRNA synthetase